MDILDGFILGLIQGLTEFLPVSSSGHLILSGKLLGFTPDAALELVAHLGTLLALVIVMRKSLFGLVRHPLSKTTRFVLLSTAVTGAVFLATEKFLRSAMDGRYLVIGFTSTAALLVFAHFAREKAKAVGWFDAVIIGFAQGAAGLPGLSRSGTTVSTARLLGIGKRESAEYSFLLAVPIILCSSAYELIGGGFHALPVLPTLSCFLTSFLSGFLALKLCLKIFTSDKAVYFSIYLILLSLFLLANDLFLHIL